MKLTGYIYILLYALLFASWCVVQETLFKAGASKNAVMFWSGSGGLLLIAISLIQRGTLPPRSSWKWFLIVVSTNVLIAECLISATEKYGAALGACSMGLAPVVAVFVGWRLLKEKPGRSGLVGVIVILAGIYLLHWDPRKTYGFLSAWENLSGMWLVYAVGIALGAGVAIVAMKPCVQMTNPLMASGVILGSSFCAWALFRHIVEEGLVIGSLSPVGGRYLLFGLLIAFFTVGNWAQAAAYRYLMAAYVGALKRLFVPLAVVLSWLVFGRQPNTDYLLTGSLLIFTGAFLIGIEKRPGTE